MVQNLYKVGLINASIPQELKCFNTNASIPQELKCFNTPFCILQTHL